MYKIIDVVKTGEKIKQELNEKGISVREVQEILHLNAQQSVFRWFRGETLPSIDNLYTIAYLLRLPMEALILIYQLTLEFSK